MKFKLPLFLRRPKIVQIDNYFSVNKDEEEKRSQELQKLFVERYFLPLEKKVNYIENTFLVGKGQFSHFLYYKFCIEWFLDFKLNNLTVPEYLDFESNVKVKETIDLISMKVPMHEIQTALQILYKLTYFLNSLRMKYGLINQSTFDRLTSKKFYLPVFERNFLNTETYSVYLNYQYPESRKFINIFQELKHIGLENIKLCVCNDNYQRILNHVKTNVNLKNSRIENCYYISRGIKDGFGNFLYTETTEKPIPEAINLGFATRGLPKKIAAMKINSVGLNDGLPVFVSGSKVVVRFSDKSVALSLRNTL